MKAYTEEKYVSYYIIPGKKYDIIEYNGESFYIPEEELFCLVYKCAHLNFSDWIIVDDD